MSEGRESLRSRVVGIIRPVPALALTVNAILHASERPAPAPERVTRTVGHPRLNPADAPVGSIRSRHGTPDPARIASCPGDQRIVLDRLRQRGLVDLLRAR